MVRLNLLASAICGCLLTASPVSATDYTELTLIFASSASIQTEIAQATRTTPALLDNDVLSPEDVFSISTASAAPQSGGLFRNTDLILNIQSTTNDITHTEILGHCTSLDLVSDAGMFGTGAECDRQSFSYAVNGHTIVVFKDKSVFREYELEAGNYMINGYPVIFN